MIFANNLHYLRKRDKVTQEDLADRLGVSRQSVSKWETGEAYPEMDKLIALSDIFNVSLDDLIRKDLTAHTEQRETAMEEENAPQDNCTQSDYIVHMNKVSSLMALGVFFILLGAGICVMLAGFGEMTADKQNLLGIFGAITVILFCAVSVFLIVFAGIRHNHFRTEHPRLSFIVPEAQRRLAEKRFAISFASLFSAVLLDVVFLVTMSMLIEEGIISTVSANASNYFVVAAFLVVLAFLFGGIVYCRIQRSKFDIEEYNRQTHEEENPTKSQKISGGICSVIMLTAAAIFLLLGFVWNKWHPSWIVFPIGGIFCAIISTIFDAKR